jgi:hypothetical protein
MAVARAQSNQDVEAGNRVLDVTGVKVFSA